jgi:hypothetical protein
MNFDFSIESSLEKIQNANTKEYFKEVYQTYVNGNYRSSTVMLYSVLVCDLVYKLRDLRDIYGDLKAKKLLDEIEGMQLKNPKSPEWESKIVEYIKDRTSFLEPSDIVAIESLQKFRHLSAHPVLNNADLLYSPNRETVQSMIRNILEGVLTNPPFFSNRIFDTMLNDLTEVKDKLTDDDGLDKYVKSRYIQRLKEDDFKKIFRSLWKVVFITHNTESIESRIINYKVLKIFISHDKKSCIDLLKREPQFYSNINNDDCVSKIIRLLASFPEFYILFESSLQLLINKKIENDDEHRFIAWFIKPTLKEHIVLLNPEKFVSISANTFKFMKSLCEQNGCKKELIDFSIEYFGLSSNFDLTNIRYNNTISNFADDLSLEQTKRLLEISNSNFQIYRRNGMRQKLEQIAEKYYSEINKTLYSLIFEA